jgi:sugar-specific transcriptional regulator TrmB
VTKTNEFQHLQDTKPLNSRYCNYKTGEKMIATQQVFDTLKTIGLNLYERKLWVALLSRGSATAGELSSLAKVPHSRTYDILESLTEKGFVSIQNARPLKYVAIQPMEALERAKNKINDDARIASERMDELKSSPVAKELDKIFKNGLELVEPGEMTASLRGRNALHDQMETIFKGAKKHVSILTTEEGLASLHAKHKEMLRKVASHGVKIRIAAPVNKENASMISAFKDFAEVKKLNVSMGRFALVDDSHVVLALTDEKTHQTQDLSFWAQSEHVAGCTLAPMFNALWKTLPSA